MNYLKLPNTDLEVSQIALGCMRIADKTVDEVERLVQCALDLGVNFFDHADIYGGGLRLARRRNPKAQSLSGL